MHFKGHFIFFWVISSELTQITQKYPARNICLLGIIRVTTNFKTRFIGLTLNENVNLQVYFFNSRLKESFVSRQQLFPNFRFCAQICSHSTTFRSMQEAQEWVNPVGRLSTPGTISSAWYSCPWVSIHVFALRPNCAFFFFLPCSASPHEPLRKSQHLIKNSQVRNKS